MPKKRPPKVGHHILYKSEKHPRAQGDIIIALDPGVHMVITDVQHRIAKDDEEAGWSLLFEGLTRIMRGRIKEVSRGQERISKSKKTAKQNGKEKLQS